jgi:thioredoxin 1
MNLSVDVNTNFLITLNVYVNGEVVKTVIGAKPKPALLKELAAYI